MGTLSNLGRIVQSIFRPGRRTVITLAPPSAEDDISTEAASETDEDITLGRKKARVPGKAEPKGKQTRRQAPKVEALALPQLVISPAFKLVVILVFVLILLSGAATVLLPIFGDPKNATLQSASTLIGSAFTASVGALLGLIGGKAFA